MRDLDKGRKSQVQSPFASASLKSVTFWGFVSRDLKTLDLTAEGPLEVVDKVENRSLSAIEPVCSTPKRRK